MNKTTTVNGQGQCALQSVELENVAHMMASFLGQLVDEGILDGIDEQITMGGMTPKVIASRLLDRFERVS